MASSVILRIPHSLAKRLEEEARRRGTSLDEYVLELIIKEAGPEESAKEYIEAALLLLEQAREELERGDVRQAAEKLWGAAALAVKAYAYWRDGKRLTSHGELWEYSRKIMNELGDWVYDAWMAATGMHVCFYEGWCTREHVREALKRIQMLVREVAKSIEA